MIGGNFVSWYGGFDSYIVASQFEVPIVSPSMGRKQEGETQLGIQQLPYMVWSDWIKILNKFKYGVHLMRTHAADTQEICHPMLSIDLGDIPKAIEMAHKLKTDKGFYNFCSKAAKENYNNYYHEDKFNTTWKEQFKIS